MIFSGGTNDVVKYNKNKNLH